MARVQCPNCKTTFDIANHDGMWVNGFHNCSNEVIGELKAAEIKNENEEKNTMAGVNTMVMGNTNGVFTVGMPDSTTSKAIIENGMVKILKEDDPILSQILKSEFIRNVDFDLQHITAQTFRLLSYKGGKEYKYSWMNKPAFTEQGWLDGFRHMYSYDYTIKYLDTITHRMAKLQIENKKMFDIEEHFFNKEVICATLKDYCNALSNNLHNRKTKNCEGEPYIRVGAKHYCDKKHKDDKCGMLFVKNIDKTFIQPVESIIAQIERTDSYAEINKLVKQVLNKKLYFKLDENADRCAAWLDAFKGRGAFFSMQNLIRHSGLTLVGEHGSWDKELEHWTYDSMNREQSLDYLMKRLDEDKGQYFRLLGLLKVAVEQNNFDFYKMMKEKYDN